MLYFRSISEEIQKLLTYAAQRFLLLGGSLQTLDLRSGKAPYPQHIPPLPTISPKRRVSLDKTLTLCYCYISYIKL